MKLNISPNHPLNGSITLPGDKSISHRAALFAALARGESRIGNFLEAGVTAVLLGALAELGVFWYLEEGVLTIVGEGLEGLHTPVGPLDCGNSATTLRLLIGALTAANIEAVLDGSEGLRRRPMKRVVAPLSQMGAQIQASDEGTAPLQLLSRAADQPLQGITYEMPVASAQVKTAILLAALAADSPTTVVEPCPSRDHTERMLASMGVQVNTQPGSAPRVTLTPPSPLVLNPLDLVIPGDFSSAAFLIVAALINPGSSITIENVGLNPTRAGLLDVLQQMGADVRINNRREQHGEPIGNLTVRYSELKAVEVSGPLVVRMIDEFPVFAVAASQAEGQTVVRDALELRHKESDRIQAICRVLGQQGISTGETRDGFVLNGQGQFQGGEVIAGGDHRLAMAMAVAGLIANTPMHIYGAEIIHESFPEFSDTLKKLGANTRHG
jgi:3-phosphoshikimate 1-carboxyvinyltransferase